MDKERMKDQITLSPLVEGEGPIELVNIKNLDFNDPEAACTILERYHAVPDLELTLERNLANDPIGAAQHVSLEGFNPGKEADEVKVLVMAAAKTQAAENTLKLSEKQKDLFDGLIENWLGAAAGWFAKDKKAVKVGSSLAVLSLALSACNNTAIPDTIKTLFPVSPEATETSTPYPTETPTQAMTETPTQTETALPTATATQTETPTPTEIPRFTELIPPTIEEVMANNKLNLIWYQDERKILKEKELANMPQDPADCPVAEIIPTTFPNYGEIPLIAPIVIENPKISSITYSNIDGREFLNIGLYIRSGDGTYCAPVVFSLDVGLNKVMPPDWYTASKFFGNFYKNSSLFSNDEANYKKLVNGEVRKITLGYITMIQNTKNENGETKNLIWLYKKNQSILSEYEQYHWFIGYNKQHTEWSQDYINYWKNSVKVTSDFFTPVTWIWIE